MRIREEEKASDSYAISYDCGGEEDKDKIIKVVRIDLKRRLADEKGTGEAEPPDFFAELEIQRPGIDLHIERLCFYDGEARMYDKGHHGNYIPQYLDEDKKNLDRILTKFALEFGEIFMENNELQKRRMSHFRDLNAYLAQYLRDTRITTERMMLPKLPPPLKKDD